MKVKEENHTPNIFKSIIKNYIKLNGVATIVLWLAVFYRVSMFGAIMVSLLLMAASIVYTFIVMEVLNKKSS